MNLDLNILIIFKSKFKFFNHIYWFSKKKEKKIQLYLLELCNCYPPKLSTMHGSWLEYFGLWENLAENGKICRSSDEIIWLYVITHNDIDGCSNFNGLCFFCSLKIQMVYAPHDFNSHPLTIHMFCLKMFFNFLEKKLSLHLVIVFIFYF